jgi:menaquinone-dependent protoporphyrinogen IX oxidase
MANMNAQDRLHAAQRAVREGRYEEALSEFVRFHEHALEELPSLYGVRLSFALSYWAHLAEVYPKARVVLGSRSKDFLAAPDSMLNIRLPVRLR